MGVFCTSVKMRKPGDIDNLGDLGNFGSISKIG